MKTAKEVIDALLEKLNSGEVFRYSQPAFIISKNGKPSASWSFLNRLTMLLSGTEDARGMKQWNKVGRKVKKGAKALSILAPRIRKISGVSVTYDGVTKAGAFTPSAYYSASTKTIVCFTHDEQTFMHELCHAAHHKIKGNLKAGQDTKQEFIAEFASACLARIYGIYTEERERAALAYCQGYLKKEKNPGALVMSAIHEVDKIIKMIQEVKPVAVAVAA